jgi:rhodanese-related sulfurtransferase
MMGLFTPATQDTLKDALALINAMLDPQKAKQALDQMREEVTRLEQARAAAVEEQKKAASDRAEADKRIVEAEARVGAMQERENNRLAELAGFERGPIVLVCRTDKRSAAAAHTLHAAGFSQVRVLRRGMQQWNEAGLPVVGRTVYP